MTMRANNRSLEILFWGPTLICCVDEREPVESQPMLHLLRKEHNRRGSQRQTRR